MIGGGSKPPPYIAPTAQITACAPDGVLRQGVRRRRDALGNIIAVLDTNGNVVVEYKYDAWGNTIVTNVNDDAISDDLGHMNPFRYRGYYYSDELGLYYLKARFYDPKVGRFISADIVDYLAPDTINGLNLYAYCNNNPVMNVDPTGRFAILSSLGLAIISGLIAAGANALGQVLFEGATWETIQWSRAIIAGISGLVSGLIPGSGFASILGQAVVSSLIENGLSAIFLGDEFSFETVAWDTMVSFGTGYAIKGLTHLTSKVTSKIFKKASSYSRYQHHYRSKGYDYSRQEMYGIIAKHTERKTISDEVIKKVFEFLFSIATYPLSLQEVL